MSQLSLMIQFMKLFTFLQICMSPPKSRGFSGNSDNSLNMPTTGLQCSHITKHMLVEEILMHQL